MRRNWRPVWIDDEETTQEYYDAQAAVYMPELPPIDDASGYFIAHLMELGPTVAAGMGAGPITFSEIDAWIRLTGARLSPSDARLIRRLSIEHLSESQKATEQFYPPPWWPEDGEPRPKTKEEVELARQDAMFR
jgi:hypothetical protein